MRPDWQTEGESLHQASQAAKDQAALDKDRSKNRNPVERFFNRIKQYRRIATRYEKAIENLAGCIWLAELMVDVHTP